MKPWDALADDATIEKTAAALRENGVEVFVVGSGAEAKTKALSLIPEGAEVMTMTSVTCDTVGLSQAFNESGTYNAVRSKLYAMDPKTQGSQMRKLGSAPDWTVGSVHAVTQDGHVLIASASGSQLPAYGYGAGHVLWVVGAQKIVKDTQEGIRRIHEHTLPLEDARAQKAYGVGSAVNNLLIINKQNPGRLTLILVKEKLGY